MKIVKRRVRIASIFTLFYAQMNFFFQNSPSQMEPSTLISSAFLHSCQLPPILIPFSNAESDQSRVIETWLLIAVLKVPIGSDGSEEISPIPSGYTPADVNDPIVKEIAAFATVALSVSENAGQLKLIQIIKAEAQVVAVINIKLILELVTVSSYYPKSLIYQVIVFE